MGLFFSFILGALHHGFSALPYLRFDGIALYTEMCQQELTAPRGRREENYISDCCGRKLTRRGTPTIHPTSCASLHGVEFRGGGRSDLSTLCRTIGLQTESGPKHDRAANMEVGHARREPRITSGAQDYVGSSGRGI